MVRSAVGDTHDSIVVRINTYSPLKSFTSQLKWVAHSRPNSDEYLPLELKTTS
jgi:hypothetical protein